MDGEVLSVCRFVTADANATQDSTINVRVLMVIDELGRLQGTGEVVVLRMER